MSAGRFGGFGIVRRYGVNQLPPKTFAVKLYECPVGGFEGLDLSVVAPADRPDDPLCQRRMKMGHDHRVKMGQVVGS